MDELGKKLPKSLLQESGRVSIGRLVVWKRVLAILKTEENERLPFLPL